MSKHTPGPWTVDAIPGLPVYVNAGDDGLRPIAEINALEDGIDNDARHEERLANAVLIAATPGLLAAAKCALADLEGLLRDEDRDVPGWQTIRELREAIDKAEPTI
jgi:hypothetical protein